MKKYVERNLTHWAGRREKLVELAGDEYRRISDIKPDTPVRWVVATHARLGAMYAQMAEELRGVTVPSSWQEKGPSEHKGADGKPMTWEQIRTEHDARIAKLMGPLLEKAKASYKMCVESASGAKIEGPFVKSCQQWLKAAK